VNNEAALSFYKKFSFEIISKANEYYRRLQPSDAYLLERTFDRSQQPSSSIITNLDKVQKVQIRRFLYHRLSVEMLIEVVNNLYQLEKLA
jgi:hypothetical protein